MLEHFSISCMAPMAPTAFFLSAMCFSSAKQTGSGESEALLLPEREKEPGENADRSSRTKRQRPALKNEAHAEVLITMFIAWKNLM